MYDALKIAGYIITRYKDNGYPINNFALQKILYLVQKEFLVKLDYPVFFDTIEAWQMSPVVPKVYYHYCGYGVMDISQTPLPQCNIHNNINTQDKLMIDSIISTKRIINPWDLFEEIYKKGGAWDLVYQNGYGNKQKISNNLIKQYG